MSELKWMSPDTADQGARVDWEWDRIVVDSFIIVWSVRYCLGSLSWAAADGYKLVVRVAHRLNDSAVQSLRSDIKERLDDEEFSGYPDIRAGWENALRALDMVALVRGLGDPR